MKILIVDDSETVRTQLRRDLEAKGYQVVEGDDGVNGLEALSQNPDVKLVISDLKMPRLDGLAMVKKIHEIPEHKALPVLMMTTESSAELKAQGKEAGVLAWMVKPYVADKLMAAVAKILSK